MRGCAAPGWAAGLAVVAAAVSPPSIARNALTVLVLGAGWWRVSLIATP